MGQNKTAYSFGDSPFFKQQMDIKKKSKNKSMTYLSVVVKMEREHETPEHIHERESMFFCHYAGNQLYWLFFGGITS